MTRIALTAVAAALAIYALFARPAFADDAAARGAVLLAEAKAAAGGAAWDKLSGWSESGSAFLGAAHGTYESWCDLHRLVVVNHHVLAGTSQTRGFDGAAAWVMAGAGPPRVSAEPAALAHARQGAYISAWGFFFPDRFPAERVYIGQVKVDGADFDVVRVTPEGGFATEVWIERSSHLITRMVDRSGPQTSVAILSDFRRVDGVLAPFLVAESDGDPDHTLELHTAKITFGPIDPARLAAPH
jgi:hypothetical protein